MNISRDWATPLTIGAFILSAVTGILMFFHWDIGLNKEAHEWLGWALVVGVAAHLTANFTSFKRYLGNARALSIIGVFVVILAASFFIQEEEKGGNPSMRVTQAVLKRPLMEVATLAGKSPESMVADLRQAGFTVTSPQQTLGAITGTERPQQFKALAVLFP